MISMNRIEYFAIPISIDLVYLCTYYNEKFVLRVYNEHLYSLRNIHLDRHVSFHVQSKVIWSWKSSFTKSTLKRAVPCMFPVVSGQLIRPSKFPSTALIMTNIRFFSSMCPLMGLQVAGFGVRFVTSVIRTGMDNLFPFCPCSLFSWFPCLRHW